MTINEDSVSDKISEEYYNLTASEKKTADYVMAHLSETQIMSITELADASKVAEATVSRFCRRLGYKGYNAFKLALAQSNVMQRKQAENPLFGGVQDTDSFDVMCEKLYVADVRAMGNTKAIIKEQDIMSAVHLMNEAKKVLFMGQGGSMLLASEAAHLFSTTGGKFFAVSDSHMQSVAASSMDENDVLMYFSYSGAVKEMVDTVNVAKERGARIILVTRFPKSPGAMLADVVLLCGANESPLQLGSVSAKVSQLFLMDVLLSEYCRHNLEGCVENRKRIADALADKHL